LAACDELLQPLQNRKTPDAETSATMADRRETILRSPRIILWTGKCPRDIAGFISLR
jgi:hypothetical protein